MSSSVKRWGWGWADRLQFLLDLISTFQVWGLVLFILCVATLTCHIHCSVDHQFLHCRVEERPSQHGDRVGETEFGRNLNDFFT